MKQAVPLIFVFLVVFLVGLGLPTQAQDSGPGVRGARAAALGGAAVALGGDVWSMGNNVAGLGEIKQPEVGFYGQNRYFSSALNVAALNLALPLGAVEADATMPRANTWAKNGVLGFEAQRFGGALYNETRFGAGYGYRLGQINLGGRVDMLQVSLQDLGSRRMAVVSLGGQAELLPHRLTFGAYIYNLNQAKLASYQDERVPTVLKAGLAFRPNNQVLLTVETEKDVERDANFKAGLEYWPVPVLAARIGLASLTEQANAGIGLRLGDFALDYSAEFQQALGFSQHVSVTKRWKKKDN